MDSGLHKRHIRAFRAIPATNVAPVKSAATRWQRLQLRLIRLRGESRPRKRVRIRCESDPAITGSAVEEPECRVFEVSKALQREIAVPPVMSSPPGSAEWLGRGGRKSYSAALRSAVQKNMRRIIEIA
jgi:hypothetical protein